MSRVKQCPVQLLQSAVNKEEFQRQWANAGYLTDPLKDILGKEIGSTVNKLLSRENDQTSDAYYKGYIGAIRWFKELLP